MYKERMIYLAIPLRKRISIARWSCEGHEIRGRGNLVESLLTIGLFININYWFFVTRISDVSIRIIHGTSSCPTLLVEIVNENIHI